MQLTEKTLRQIIEFHVKKKLMERTLLQLPDDGGNNIPPTDDIDMELPPDENMEQPPMDDPNMEEIPQQVDNPHIAELVELLELNPDRAEGVLKYAKGIIGNDNIPGDTDGDGDPDNILPQQPPMGESRSFDLDEMISDIITGNKQKSKPTITRPIGKTFSMKSRMFRPTMGSSS
jgi:hypothetical protein